MLKTIPLILILAVGAFAQSSVTELKAKAKSEKLKDLIIGYDKFKDRSTIMTKPQNVLGSWEGAFAIVGTGMIGPNKAQSMLMLTIGYEFTGQTLDATPSHYAIIFQSGSSDWNFLKGDTNLYILYDEHRLELNAMGQDSDVVLSRLNPHARVSEKLGFAITRDDLEKIMAAKKVEFRLGDTRPREWKPDWSKRIQALLTLTKIK